MANQDLVLSRFQKDSRTTYLWCTLVLAIFSVFMFYMQEGWASPIMFAATVSFLWFYHWNTGRRIQSGDFATGTSAWSSIERADLARWIEHRGAQKIPDANLPG